MQQSVILRSLAANEEPSRVAELQHMLVNLCKSVDNVGIPVSIAAKR